MSRLGFPPGRASTALAGFMISAAIRRNLPWTLGSGAGSAIACSVTRQAALAAVLPEQGAAHINWTAAGELRPYSFSRSDCWAGSRKDPIGIVFYDKGQMEDNIDNHMLDHTTLVSPVMADTTQYFGVHGCRPNGSAWAQTTPSRYHIRVRMGSQTNLPGTPDNDPTYGKYSVSTPHIDHLSCWHLVEDGDFDTARNAITNAFISGGHTAIVQNWANTLKAEQCDGSMAGSLSGAVWYIRLTSNDPSVHP